MLCKYSMLLYKYICPIKIPADSIKIPAEGFKTPAEAIKCHLAGITIIDILNNGILIVAHTNPWPLEALKVWRMSEIWSNWLDHHHPPTPPQHSTILWMGNIDDQHRNPNMNKKDHTVRQLTSCANFWSVHNCTKVWSAGTKLAQLQWSVHLLSV